MDLHKRLTEARIAAGYESATQAAAALGVKYPTYAGHENGSSRFKPATGAKYARKFKVRLEWLMFGLGPMKPGTDPDDLDAEWSSWGKALKDAGQLETAKRLIRALIAEENADEPPPVAQTKDATKARSTK